MVTSRILGKSPVVGTVDADGHVVWDNRGTITLHSGVPEILCIMKSVKGLIEIFSDEPHVSRDGVSRLVNTLHDVLEEGVMIVEEKGFCATFVAEGGYWRVCEKGSSVRTADKLTPQEVTVVS